MIRILYDDILLEENVKIEGLYIDIDKSNFLMYNKGRIGIYRCG